MQNFYIASDHAGFELKKYLIENFPWESYSLKVIDLGTDSGTESVDYPDYAHSLCKAMLGDDCSHKSALICGSGIGVNITANRHKGIRAAVLHSEDETVMARRHDDINVACFAGRVIEFSLAIKLMTLFLETEFDGGRHLRRVEKIDSGLKEK